MSSLQQAVDIEIQAREIMYHKNNLNQIMADYTGQPFEKVGDGAVCANVGAGLLPDRRCKQSWCICLLPR